MGTRILRALAAIGVLAVSAASLAAAGAPATSKCALFPAARHTVAGLYRVSITSCPASIPTNQPTAWTVRVTTRSGRPVAGRLEVTGGMPEHRHGFLTPPVITRGAHKGVYRAQLVFAMRGRWVIEFRMAARGRRDVVRYQVTV